MPYDTSSLLTPSRNGIDYALTIQPVPALDLSEESTPSFEGKSSKMTLRLVELSHERVYHDPKECLLHRKRANTLEKWEAFHLPGGKFKKTLTGLIRGMWIKRRLQFAGGHFHGRICKRFEWHNGGASEYGNRDWGRLFLGIRLSLNRLHGLRMSEH